MEIKQLSDIDPIQANNEYIELTNLCHGLSWDFSDNAFIKKHQQNPFGKSYGCWIYEKNKLIALNLFLCWEFISNNRIIKAAQSVDSLVHPEYQGRGLFRKVQETCMDMIPPNIVRFGFPNEMSKPCLLKFGWELSERYVTKIYPQSWLKFAHKRYLQKAKNFKSELGSLNNALIENKKIFDTFFSMAVKENITNYNYELLYWKLSIDKNLRIQIFQDSNSMVIALLIYTIQYIDDYKLLVVSDFITLDDDKFDHLINQKIKSFIKNWSINEIQYSGTNHKFFDKLFLSVKTKNADLILHPLYGSQEDIFSLANHINLSKFVTDHV